MKSRKPSLSDKVGRRKALNPKQEVRRVQRRIYFVACVFVLVYIALLCRAYYLQVYNAAQLRVIAEQQHQKKVSLTPQRGAIFDRNGEPLAISLAADSVYVNPVEMYELLAEAEAERAKSSNDTSSSSVTAPEKKYHTVKSIAKDVSRVLDLHYQTVLRRLQQQKKFIWLKRRISKQESEALKALELPGIHYIREHERWYPNGKVSGQVLGFSGLDDDGLEGLELRYNSVLASDKSYLIMQRDGGQRGLGSGQQVITGQLGKDIYLTIDSQLQYIAEKELAQAVADTKARRGSVVVLDPFSGQVLAMASNPDYDPNDFGKYSAAARRNRVVCDTFEPGSTFKLFLMAAALDSNTITPNSVIDCGRGSYRVGGKVIHDHIALGPLSVSDVLKYSSNIGCTKIAQKMGAETFYRYLQNFGFGEKTDIDFDGEGSGLLRRPQQWFAIDLAAISFGQGVTVTALQMAVAASAIVNGGELYRPYLVQRTENPRTKAVDEQRPMFVRRVIGRDTAAHIRQMMVGVTDSDGTGSRAQVAGFSVGGKTGTAQKVDQVTGTYSVDKRVSSFIGFAPASDPQIVIMVMLDEPKVEKTYGGLLAAPVFSKIAEQSLRYLHVPARYNKQDILASPADTPFPELPALNRLTMAVDPGTEVMPDCSGLSARQVLRLMEKSGINIMLKGTGRVVQQSPAAGQSVAHTGVVWVQLQPPQ
ncbi:MAG: penicillin-binding protein [Desulfuromonas sp.]|nr:penicillin-binding protein [Desulfuromonas sp.]